MANPITDADLHAFIDGQLDEERQIEVEEYLACHPEVATRLMADMRVQNVLKHAFTEEGPAHPSPRVLEAARRLERGFTWRQAMRRFGQVAAMALLIGIGWFAHNTVGLFEITETEASPKPPAFVADAVHSHETELLRGRMTSQLAIALYDPAEILDKTGIIMPVLPEDWRVADVQVFPSHDGHGIEIALDAQDLGRVSLFAARQSTFRVIAPTIAWLPKSRTVYWQSGPLAYALTGSAPGPALKEAAEELAESLR